MPNRGRIIRWTQVNHIGEVLWKLETGMTRKDDHPDRLLHAWFVERIPEGAVNLAIQDTQDAFLRGITDRGKVIKSARAYLYKMLRIRAEEKGVTLR